MNNKKEIGNPYGAGRCGYMRSAENRKDMIQGKDAKFDIESNRWIECLDRGYDCFRDGKYLQESDDADMYFLHTKDPTIECRESVYDFQYGDTLGDVAHVFVILAEYEQTRYRTFVFFLDNISRAEMNEYMEAVEKWHKTGELNIGPYQGIPEYGLWEAK